MANDERARGSCNGEHSSRVQLVSGRSRDLPGAPFCLGWVELHCAPRQGRGPKGFFCAGRSFYVRVLTVDWRSGSFIEVREGALSNKSKVMIGARS